MQANKKHANNLRIAVFAGSFPVPSETFILNQVVELKKRGHDVQVFGYRHKGPGVLHPAFLEHGIGGLTHHPWKIAPFTIVRVALGFIQFLMLKRCRNNVLESLNQKKFGWMASSLHLFYWSCLMTKHRPFDVVHAHFVEVGGRCGMLKSLGLLDCPIVTSFHGADVSAQQTSEGRVLIDFAKQNSILFTFNTEYIAGKAKAMGFPSERMRQLPVGLEMEKFPFHSRSGRDGKAEILSVARLDEAKGIHIALDALAKVSKAGRHFRYRIIGEGPWRERLENQIAVLGLRHCVELPGWKNQADVARLLGEADIFLLPSITGSDGRTEGQGLALQEAQASGLPVIATIHNGFPENIENGETGLLVPENDADGLSECILSLIKNPELRLKIGMNARQFVEKKFDIRILADRHEEILRESIEIYRGSKQ
jgi:colanic acid/amylovoran biosynthesis glycosyltransferase